MVDSEIYAIQYTKKKLLELADIVEQTTLDSPSIVVERPYYGTSGKADDRITICVNDKKNSFWPCIVRLTKEEAIRLSHILVGAAEHSDKEKQFYEEIATY